MNGLNPVKRIGDQLVEAIQLHENVGARDAAQRSADLLERVGIARSRSTHYPHEFSGGMRQRAMIAMALACRPPLVIADEPTTALDVMIQAQILELLASLRREMGMALIVITHDLSVLAEVSDRVAIMYAGRIVEEGSAHEVLTHPLHPYSRALVEAFPRIGATEARRIPRGLAGDPPDPAARPPGCAFHPRCPGRFEPCDTVDPALLPYADRSCACHLVELERRG
jgi:peptide/nickel transport system ATP-binding protein